MPRAVQVGPSDAGLVHSGGPSRISQWQRDQRLAPSQVPSEHSIRRNVLHRLFRSILGHRPIIVVVMCLNLPVEHCMRRFPGGAKRPRSAAHGEYLPEGRDHQDEEDEAAVHPVSLCRGARCARGKSVGFTP